MESCVTQNWDSIATRTQLKHESFPIKFRRPWSLYAVRNTYLYMVQASTCPFEKVPRLSLLSCCTLPLISKHKPLFRHLFKFSLTDFLGPGSTKTGWILRVGFGLMRADSLSSDGRRRSLFCNSSEASSSFISTWRKYSRNKKHSHKANKTSNLYRDPKVSRSNLTIAQRRCP